MRTKVAIAALLLPISAGTTFSVGIGESAAQRAIPTSKRAEAAIGRTSKPLAQELKTAGFRQGAQVYLRIFKKENQLEVWLKKNGQFHLFKTFPICEWSGELGPKLQEGDMQSPEGFYFIKPVSLNPHSTYHLSMNLGFPNLYDRRKGRTGTFLMIHGDCISVGCYAMTNAVIEKLWSLVVSAFRNAQPYIRVHIFPFRMTDANMKAHAGSRWYSFWRNLREGYDAFQNGTVPPNTTVRRGRYVFQRKVSR